MTIPPIWVSIVHFQFKAVQITRRSNTESETHYASGRIETPGIADAISLTAQSAMVIPQSGFNDGFTTSDFEVGFRASRIEK